MEKKWKKMVFSISVAVLCGLPVGVLQAAARPITITADVLAYDGETRVATADGNVYIRQGETGLTGQHAIYNIKTDVAEVSGNACIVQPDLQVRAAKIEAYQKNHIIAAGNVQAVKGDKRLQGARVDYYIDRNYGIITGHAFLEAQGAKIWANRIEAWLQEVRAVGTGKVRVESSKNQLSATGNMATYTQTPGKNDGILNLTGNVHAVQKVNIVQGPAVQVRAADKSVRTFGRSTLVLIPKDA